MSYFPLCVDLTCREVLLIGGGKLTDERLEKLLPFGCRIRLLVREGYESLADHPQILLEHRDFCPEDLDRAPVFVAVADRPREESARISALCRARGIPVNSADQPELCSFYFPAMITKGDFTLAISTGGKSPAAAALLRQQLEPQIPTQMEAILDWSQPLRQEILATVPDPQRRRRILRSIMAAAMELDRPLTPEETAEFLR